MGIAHSETMMTDEQLVDAFHAKKRQIQRTLFKNQNANRVAAASLLFTGFMLWAMLQNTSIPIQMLFAGFAVGILICSVSILRILLVRKQRNELQQCVNSIRKEMIVRINATRNDEHTTRLISDKLTSILNKHLHDVIDAQITVYPCIRQSFSPPASTIEIASVQFANKSGNIKYTRGFSVCDVLQWFEIVHKLCAYSRQDVVTARQILLLFFSEQYIKDDMLFIDFNHQNALNNYNSEMIGLVRQPFHQIDETMGE